MARTDNRKRASHIASFEERLIHEAHNLEEQAKTAQSGTQRDHLLRKARQAETAADISKWLSVTGSGVRSPVRKPE
jgi:hypothetical protein